MCLFILLSLFFIFNGSILSIAQTAALLILILKRSYDNKIHLYSTQDVDVEVEKIYGRRIFDKYSGATRVYNGV